MWIKICGNTTLEDARLAADAGADALGFVFAPSPRRVTEAQAGRIVAEIPPEIETYGVFVDASLAEIITTVSACGVTGVQLHRSADAGLAVRLREHFAGLGRKLSILRVVDWNAIDRNYGRATGSGLDFDEALGVSGDNSAVDAILVDSSTARAPGGTGACFDWVRAQSSFLQAAPRLRMIVAGGLRPENVKQAISILRPWGVDVVSGVEAAPGKKDGARVAAFVRAAREAAREALTVSDAGENRPHREPAR